LHFYHNLQKIVINTENFAFSFWIAIKVKRKKIIFEVPILDLDHSFVKIVAKLMAHPVTIKHYIPEVKIVGLLCATINRNITTNLHLTIITKRSIFTITAKILMFRIVFLSILNENIKLAFSFQFFFSTFLRVSIQ